MQGQKENLSVLATIFIVSRRMFSLGAAKLITERDEKGGVKNEKGNDDGSGDHDGSCCGGCNRTCDEHKQRQARGKKCRANGRADRQKDGKNG